MKKTVGQKPYDTFEGAPNLRAAAIYKEPRWKKLDKGGVLLLKLRKGDGERQSPP